MGIRPPEEWIIDLSVSGANMRPSSNVSIELIWDIIQSCAAEALTVARNFIAAWVCRFPIKKELILVSSTSSAVPKRGLSYSDN
jgi:hypothetical protein